jgi:hypothetical protein
MLVVCGWKVRNIGSFGLHCLFEGQLLFRKRAKLFDVRRGHV